MAFVVVMGFTLVHTVIHFAQMWLNFVDKYLSDNSNDYYGMRAVRKFDGYRDVQ